MTVKQLLEIRQLITMNQLLEIQQLMKPLMTVDTNTFPVHVYFTFVHDLIIMINVALNNIVVTTLQTIKTLRCHLFLKILYQFST